MKRLLRAAGAVALLAATWLAGCGGNGSSGTTANVRLLNASPGYPSLDLYVDDVKQGSSVAFGATGSYSGVSTSSVTTTISSSGSTSSLSSASRSFSKDSSYTLVAYGWQGAVRTAVIDENTTAPASGKSVLSVLNTAVDAGSVDVYLTGSDELLDNASPAISSVAGGSSAGSFSIASGTYRLRITGSGDKTDLRLDVSGVVLPSAGVQTLVLTPGSGGVLVSALQLAQQGSATVLANTQARARVVASVTANGKVTAALGGKTLLSGGVSPAIGSYASVTAGALTPTVAVNGVIASTSAQTLTAGGDYTLLVWGDAAAPQVALIADDNRLPSVSTSAKMRLMNAVNGLNTSLTLTADFSALASNVTPGTASSYGSFTAGSAVRLDVTAGGSTLYTLTDASIAAKGVYTVFMLGDSTSPSALVRKER